MDKALLIGTIAGAVLLAIVAWNYASLQSDLSASVAREQALSAANSANLAAIDVLKTEKLKTEEALVAEAKARKATADSLAKIRKDIQNAQNDPACMAADDRDRALAGGLRNLLANSSN